MNEIGNKLYNRRKELGLTMEEVGQAVGVGKSTVNKWEKGMIKNMGRDKIAALSRVLQMSPAEICPADWEEKDPLESLREKIRTNPKYGILFDAAANVSEDDIMKVVKMLEAFKEEE